MTALHTANTPWATVMSRYTARTLAPAAVQRWLRVDDGCLWVTRQDSDGQRDDDIWLCAGGSLALPPHSAWVLQAWPAARVSVLQQPAGLTVDKTAAKPWWRPAAWLSGRYTPLLHA